MANSTPGHERPLIENYVFERESKMSPPSMKLSTYAMEHLTDDERSAKDIKSQYVMPELQMAVPGNQPNYHYVTSDELNPTPIGVNKSEDTLLKWVNNLKADFVRISVNETGKLVFVDSGEQDIRTAASNLRSFTGDELTDCKTANDFSTFSTAVGGNSVDECRTAALQQSVLELKTCEDDEDADCSTAIETKDSLNGLTSEQWGQLMSKFDNNSAALLEELNKNQPLEHESSRLVGTIPNFDPRAVNAGGLENDCKLKSDGLRTGRLNSEKELKTGRLLSEMKTGRLVPEKELNTGRLVSEKDLNTGRLVSEKDLRTGRLLSEKDLRTGRLVSEKDLKTGRLLSDKLPKGVLNSEKELLTALLKSASQHSTKTALLSSEIPEDDVATAVSPTPSFEQMTAFMARTLYGNDDDLHTAADSPTNTARERYDDADLVTSEDNDLASSTTET